LPSPILRQIDLVNALTLVGLLLSLLTVTFAVQQQFYAAVICLMYAGIVDLFDGLLAGRVRRPPLAAAAGKQIDSLVDVCCFGFAPAVFAYCFGLRDPLSLALLAIYIAVNVLRLAYFNAAGLAGAGDARYYTGLPVTYAALFIPLVFTASFFLKPPAMKAVMAGLFALLSLAMASGVRVRKLRGVWYVLFSLAALAMTGVYVRAMMAK
jgi:CDP-diacylglycerol--serine O-phosphatidyltransferase